MSNSTPANADAELLGRTGFRLVELGKAALAVADAALAEHGLTGRHLRALTLAASGVPSQQGMAERSGIDRTTIVAVLDDLERLGHVRRRRDPADRRRHLVEITDDGRAVLRTASRALDRAEKDLFADLSATERRHLDHAVEQVLRRVRDRPGLPPADC
ncbi:MarR family winged helix-turn-helix transcriptional regulator [Actinocatenispora rupis]|uniref:MarR family transcriptional regulator n=1 Tax=Actinocatenispora rupis TaxID=519421 RepID=A0A8J3JAC7_9ACTN|nr:MarR family transcriptional regulator [Actinocatenispora rupis]GID13029.1 MarR family transcriptional regulator [Actinocatenispora rupis]